MQCYPYTILTIYVDILVNIVYFQVSVTLDKSDKFKVIHTQNGGRRTFESVTVNKNITVLVFLNTRMLCESLVVVSVS